MLREVSFFPDLQLEESDLLCHFHYLYRSIGDCNHFISDSFIHCSTLLVIVFRDYSLFFHDMRVFLDDSSSSFEELRAVMSKYETISGARFNLIKFCILLLRVEKPLDWIALVGCKLMERSTAHKYLDASIGMEMTSNHRNDFCVEKVAESIGGWDSSFLSLESRYDSTTSCAIGIIHFLIIFYAQKY